MRHTQSATELDAVLIEPEGPGVRAWLRRDIAEVEVELDDGGTQTMWEADEVEGTFDRPVTAEEVEEDFDAIWDAFEREAMTMPERIDESYHLAERAAAQADFTAIMTDTLIEEV